MSSRSTLPAVSRAVYMNFVFSFALALALAPAAARAALVPVSRESTLQITGLTAGDASYDRTERLTDPFDIFALTLSDEAQSGESRASSATGQTSSVGGSGGRVISISAATGATAMISEFGGRAATAESTFVYRFRVDEDPVPFEFDGTVTAGGSGRAHVRLVNDDTAGVIAEAALDEGEGETESVREAGLLAPGTYTLDARAFVSGTPFVGDEAGFGVDLVAIPLPPGIVPGAAVLVLLAGRLWVRRRI